MSDATIWPPASFLALLPERDVKALLSSGTRVWFQSGEQLAREGERRTEVFLITSGFVKITGAGYDGREVLLAIRTAGDLTGELGALDGEPRGTTITAATPVTAILLPEKVFLHLMERSPDTRYAVQKFVTRKLRTATRHRIDVGGASVFVRLARVLTRLADSHGHRTEAGVRIEVPLTQVELAALVAAAEPSLHRALTRMRQEGIVTTGYKHILITDYDRLAALAGDQTG